MSQVCIGLTKSSYLRVLTWFYLISERKIDDIAKGVDGIKHLLRGLNVSADTNRHGSYPIAKPSQPDHVRPATENQPISVPCGEPLWDHSAHIIDFVKTVVEERDSKLVKNEENQIFSSLKSLLQTLENPTSTLHQSLSGVKAAKCTSNLPMPPLEAAVAVLRWAKGSVPATNEVSDKN